MSGSFVTAGQCYARLVNVGDEAYVAKLNAQAKAMGEGEQSEMIRSINRIVMAIGITVIPIGAALFAQGYFINGEGVQKSIVSMVAAIIGMIPEGLYLLTTVALALSTIKLASQKVLLHDMKSIEALARVDVLCVDKTGTITEPKMQVERIVAAVSNFVCDGRYPEAADAGSAVQSAVAAGSDIKNAQLVSLLAEYTAACDDSNATMEALREYLAKGIGMAKKDKEKITGKQGKVLDVLPFSSSRKYSSVTFEDGTYYLGAPEFVMQDGFGSVEAEISAFTDQGYRVLLLAKETSANTKIALGYVILSNPIRENAVKTFSYFKEQGVSVKVISGDNPRTVSQVALQAGIENAEEYVDAATLTTEEALKTAANKYTVFGRVTPQQKRELVAAMQGAGHTVAMTGDGVNDILAMKDADCSVAMASGSEAAAQAAQVVLLDSDFARMPDLLLMDGGRGQVNIALGVLEKLGIAIPVCGMVKDDHHRTRGLYYNNKEIDFPANTQAFNMITRLQDEAHRFAIEYHRSLRSKSQIHSVLDDIEGIGPARRKALLAYFKDIDKIRAASIADLEIPQGMNKTAATAVYNFFHNDKQK